MNRKELTTRILVKIRENPGINCKTLAVMLSATRYEIANVVHSLCGRRRIRKVGDVMPRRWEINPNHPTERMAADAMGGTDTDGETKGWIEA